MRIEFDDGGFLQIEKEDQFVTIIQCAKKDRKVIMSSAKLTQEQAQKVLDFLKGLVKENNE
jgi:FtsZ-interacting cell division protein YlmF